jgi:tellurite resistance protein
MTDLEVHQATLAVMCHILSADGRISDEELETACASYSAVSGRSLTKRQLRSAMAMRNEDDADLLSRLHGLRDRIDDADKVEIVQAGYQVAMVEDGYHDQERALLKQVAACLALTGDWREHLPQKPDQSQV